MPNNNKHLITNRPTDDPNFVYQRTRYPLVGKYDTDYDGTAYDFMPRWYFDGVTADVTEWDGKIYTVTLLDVPKAKIDWKNRLVFGPDGEYIGHDDFLKILKTAQHCPALLSSTPKYIRVKYCDGIVFRHTRNELFNGMRAQIHHFSWTQVHSGGGNSRHRTPYYHADHCNCKVRQEEKASKPTPVRS